MANLSDLLAPLTDHKLQMSLGVALLFLLVTATVFLGLGILIGRWQRKRKMEDVFR